MNKKTFAVGIIILTIGIPSCIAGDVDVKSVSSVGFDGNTLYVGGSGPNNYTTIQSAIDDAVDGDTVFVYDDSSPYYENIVVDKGINLIGENKETTFIDGDDSNNVVHIIQDYVTMNGFSITGGRAGPYAHIKLNSDYNTITNNIITSGSPSYGLYIISSSNNVISNNIIYGKYNGIWLGGQSENNEILYNEVLNCNRGIGIHGTFSDNLINNSITRNNISNPEFGIWLKCVENTLVSENKIFDSNIGLQIESSINCIIYGNSFYKNIFGIFTLNGFNENIIINKNNFLFNIIHATTYGQETWSDNYWGRPRILPKVILSIVIEHYYPGFSIPRIFIRVDSNPAQIPHVIEWYV